MTLHIHAPKGEYIAQVRKPYHRLWETVGVPFEDKHSAVVNAAWNLTGDYKKARVLFCADYYDPIIVMEASL